MKLESPGLNVDAAGVAHSRRFADVYASRAGAAAQANEVYLAGVGLPQRWANQPLHSILELGFGLGGNFLSTLSAWRDDPNACAQLDYIAIEGFPIAAADFAQLNVHRHPLIGELAGRWPAPDPGFHCLEFDGGRVRLILIFWDVLKALVELNCRVDSVYLDGFAPAKNPEMWARPVLAGVRRLLKPGARLASYSVAGALRNDLSELGFFVERKAGFAEKKQRLQATLPVGCAVFARDAPERIAIIGAGIAGMALAERLCAAGFNVTLFDAAAKAGAGASGVPAALMHPPSGSTDSFEFGIQEHAHRLAIRRIAALTAAGFDTGYRSIAIYEQRKNGRTLDHPDGGWLRPERLLSALQAIAISTGKLTLKCGCAVQSVIANGAGAALTVNVDDDGQPLVFERVIVCNGIAATDLLPNLSLRPVTGQVELIQSMALPAITKAYCGQSNIIPMAADLWCVGNSYERGVIADLPKRNIRAQLLKNAAEILHDAEFARFNDDCTGWVGTRVESNLRLPLIGELSPGLWLNTAHSSKGFMTAFFAAEMITSSIAGRACAIPERLLRAVALAGRAYDVPPKSVWQSNLA